MTETLLTGISLTTLDGRPTTLAALAEGAVLVVNVASKCGLTPQYTALEQLAKDYGQRGLTVIGDPYPGHDVFSSTTSQMTVNAKTIGDLLNDANLSWGSFMGGFDLSVVNGNGTTGCARLTNPTVAITPAGTPLSPSTDYIPHHAWFQYYA